MKLRRAMPSDFSAIINLDPIAQREASRVEFIDRSLRSALCMLAIEGDEAIAYAVLDTTFFGQGYISMLFVHPNHRRRGVGSQLMKSLEAACNTEKLFTSTNRSNAPMQALLHKLGYLPSGFIENLDEGDPELIYFKRIPPQAD